jgi:prevent-host-death family protein
MARLQLQEATARLSELLQSLDRGPHEITVRGRPAAVIRTVLQPFDPRSTSSASCAW